MPTSLQRHNNMAAIHSKDTKPEMVVRRYLWSHGFRYRLNHSRLPGKPDIVLRKYRTCIFVNIAGLQHPITKQALNMCAAITESLQGFMNSLVTHYVTFHSLLLKILNS